MNIELMRKVDYWLGMPLCWLLTMPARIGKLLGRCTAEPKSILFIELSEMGSTVIAYSAMKKAKKLWPNARLYFMIFSKNRESVEILDIIPKGNIITISTNSAAGFVASTIKAIIKCRREKIDTALDLELFSRFTAILAYLSGARNRAGFYRYHMEGLYRGELLTHRIAYNPHQHVGINFLALVEALKAPKEERPMLKKHISANELHVPRINAGEAEKEHIWNKMRKENPKLAKGKTLIAVNPNAGLLPIRAWPIQNYAALCKKLAGDGAMIVITGVGAEQDAQQIIKTAGSENCINMVGKTTLKELLHLYDQCKALITNDSGPAHFAPMTSTKTIAFFGPETHKLYGPIGNVAIISAEYQCSPCVSAFNHRKTTCTDNKCLKSISVEKVYETVKKNI